MIYFKRSTNLASTQTWWDKGKEVKGVDIEHVFFYNFKSMISHI